MNKQYFTYLCKQNKGFIILSHFIAFVVVFLFHIISTPKSYIGHEYNFASMLALAYLLGCVYAFLAPIYLFSFTQKKTSAQTYFSLPIKREKLFTTTALFSILISVTPIILWVLITATVSSGMDALFGQYFPNCIIGLVALFAIHAMSLLICQLTTNVLDSFVCNGAYVILPIFVYLGIQSLLSDCLDEIVIGMGNYTDVFDDIIYFLSPGMTGLCGSGILGTTAMIYWFVVAIVMIFFAYHLFKIRKAEVAENYTNSLFIYPVIMSVVVFSLLLMGFKAFIWVAFIFVIYLLMYFFWKRKVTFNIKLPVVFALMYAFTFGFNRAVIATDGFGCIDEVPSLTGVGSVEIIITNGYTYDVIQGVYVAKDKDDILKIHEFHQKLVESKKTDNWRKGYSYEENDVHYECYIRYYRDNDEVSRDYMSSDYELVRDVLKDVYGVALEKEELMDNGEKE